MKVRIKMFKLDQAFVDRYSLVKPPFGFNGLGELVYMRTYSRLKADGTNEQWFETIRRVVEGTYSLQKEQIDNLNLGWNPDQAQRSAQEMYSRMFDMKFLPPGRGLWAMGTDIINRKGLAASLNNCGFVSTAGLGKTIPFSKPFVFLMDMCMLGVGVGFDTEGAEDHVMEPMTINVRSDNKIEHIVEDTREGWINALKVLLESFHVVNTGVPIFDFSRIRPAGVPLKTFGGVSSGPQPLIELLNNVTEVLTKGAGKPVTVTAIVDIMNLIGKCVVSGNIRRCLPEGTLIHTEDGLVPIEKVVVGQKVHTSLDLAEVSEVVFQGEQEVIHVVTEIGTFKCTDRHKMAVLRSFGNDIDSANCEECERYTWKQARDLSLDDQLVFPIHEIVGKERSVVAFGNTAFDIDPEIAFLLGYHTLVEYPVESFNRTSELNQLEKVLQLFMFEFSKSMFAKISVPEFILRGPVVIRQNYLKGIESANRGSNPNFYKIINTLQALYSSVGVPVTEKLEKLEKLEQSLIGIKIIDIKLATGESVRTWDLSVPGAEEFIAGEGLLVHNTAEIAFGKATSTEFMDLKDYSTNPQRVSYGWTSNNSIFAELGMDYSDVAKRIQLNGEPGIAWLSNMQDYSRMVDPPDHKDYRVKGGNPCLEQSLESMELCCVTGDTRIQTRMGCPMIKNVVDTPVDVWNGVDWSRVVPFKASNEVPIYRVTMSDGSVLDCTSDHKWSIVGTGNDLTQLETKDLVVGSKVEPFELLPTGNGTGLDSAYELGMFAGIGFLSKTKRVPLVCLRGYKLDLKKLTKLGGTWTDNTTKPTELVKQVKRVNESFSFGNLEEPFKKLPDKNILSQLVERKSGLPDFVFGLNTESIKRYVAGYIDSKGIVKRVKYSQSFQVFDSEAKIRDIQLLIRRIGINNTSIYCKSPVGSKTAKGVREYSLFSIVIYDSPTAREIGTYLKKIPTPVTVTWTVVNSQRFQKIISVTQLPTTQETYCFTEPKTHKGVFGNVLTYQCLVESFPARADSLSDYLRTLKFAYLYAKTVTLGMTHWEETNRVQLRNRRIGCSVSGVAQFLAKYNIHTLNNWLNHGYHVIQDWDRVYSEWLCIPKSIKTTSVKPSGTVSLLAGATPGMHFPESRFYIRRMRISNTSPLVEGLISAGYTIEPAVGSEETTLVVEIPVDVGEGIRTVNDVSMWEQVALAANMQRWWADNQVSCTVTFNPETEGKQIASVLDYFQYQLKGISFLPKCNFGAYPQMPYEEITEERYLELVSGVKPINFFTKPTIGVESVGEMYCDSEKCVKL